MTPGPARQERNVIRLLRDRLSTGRQTAWACVGLAALCTLFGFQLGSKRAYLRDKRVAEGPELLPDRPAEWQEQAPPSANTDEPAAPSGVAVPDVAVVVDVTKPIRITWPLDIGPEPGAKAATERFCLRARQGVAELQTPGTGRALYGFRLAAAADYKTWFHVRWSRDGIGSVMCNNSWFAGFDDRPLAVIGNETKEKDWFWQPGPTVSLGPGEHWLRVELREDGPLMDKVAIVPATAELASEALDALAPVAFHGFEGRRIPELPHHPIQPVECYALPTDSLAIGAGHTNTVTVCASSQSDDDSAFEGTIDVRCATAPGLVVHGDSSLRCSADAPYVRRVLTLQFPDAAPRRVHRTTVSVRDADGQAVYRTELRFLKGYAWAFLGPFRDTSGAGKKLYRYTGAVNRLSQACDADPLQIAKLAVPGDLGLAELPLVGSVAPAEWQLVTDGSCYDWTGAIDLHSVFGVGNKPAFAYAVTWINAETTLHHRSFTFQADDSGWLWVNGHTAVQLPIDLPREANRLWTSVPLKKGINPAVIKLTQNKAYWGFRFDVVDWHWQGRRGDVITGAEPSVWPK